MAIDDDSVESYLPERFAGDFFVPNAPNVRVTVGAATHPGKVRLNNEDHYLVSRRSRWQEVLSTNLPRGILPTVGLDDYLIIVADGIGGAAFGEVASRRVLQTLWDLLAQASSWVMRFTEFEAHDFRRRVNAYVEQIEQQLSEITESEPELIGAGTTVTTAHLMGRDAMIVNIGDSRAYVCRDNSCRQITHDHTMGQTLKDAGFESEQIERLNSILLNCLSIEKESRAVPELHHERLEDGDRLLLCTDGLSDMLSDPEIAEVVRRWPDARAACDALIDRALERGGRDNVTVALAQIEVLDSPQSIDSAN